MLLNEIKNDVIRSFDNFKLSKSLNKNNFVDLFEYHINRLMLVFLNSGGVLFTRNERFSYTDYISLVQSALEDSEIIEDRIPNNYSLVDIDKKVNYILNKINTENVFNKSHFLIKKFVRDSLNYFFIYENMFPNSEFNPFMPLVFIFSKGILLGISDKESELETISKTISKRYSRLENKNICLVAIGASDRKNNYTLSNTLLYQMKVFKYLKDKKINFTLPESYNSIINQSLAPPFRKNSDFEKQVALPLKRTGVVGSTIEHLFFISTSDDLIESEKFQNIKRIMDNDVLNVIQAKKQKWKISNKYLTEKDLSEIDNLYSIFIKKTNYKEKFEERNEKYQTALSILKSMIGDEFNKNFEANFDKLVAGKNYENRLLSSNGLYRSKTNIIENRFLFMKILRDLYSHKSERVSDVYDIYLQNNHVKGFGVNLITELLHTMDIQKFPVFNGNTKLALRIFKIYYFSSELTGKNYEKLYYILSEIKERYNFKNFGQVDIFLNFVYRNYAS